MKIAIVGAGVAGVTSAYELARAGHQVTVFERRASAAEESSFAPGAVLGPGLLAPWAMPGAMAAPRILGADARVRVARRASVSEMRWLWQWRSAARKALRSPEPTPAMRALARLSTFSQQCYQETAEALELALEGSEGALVLLRDERGAAPLRAAVEALRGTGAALHEVDAAGARALEPGLADAEPLALALHLPQAQAGNCRQFSGLLRQAAQRMGVEFVFNADVTRVSPAGAHMALHLKADSQARRFDAAVLCAGADATPLLQALGLQLGLVALWGSSLTAPLREDAPAPQGVLIDVARQVTISRLGQRVRVAGGAELGRGDGSPHPATLQLLYDALDAWFPGSAVRGNAMQLWRGARPMRPSGLPALGASGIPGLWLNLGHGACGWSLASGCARLLADAMTERPPALAPDELAHFVP